MGTTLSQGCCMQDRAFNHENQDDDDNNLYAMSKSMIQGLQSREKVFFGDKIEIVCLLQAAEIERLAIKIQQYQTMFLELKKNSVDRYLNELETNKHFITAKNISLSPRHLEQMKPKEELIKIKLEKLQPKSPKSSFFTQLQALRLKNTQLISQNEHLKQQLQKENQEKNHLKTKLATLTSMETLNYQKQEEYKQTIAQNEAHIKKLKKRLKERNIEIRSLSYELQESQTNQCSVLEENEQLMFSLSKLLMKDSARQKSQAFSNYFGTSQVNKSKRLDQQSFKSKSLPKSNLLVVPGSKLVQHGSLGPARMQRQLSMKKKSFLDVIQQFPFKNNGSKVQNRSQINHQQGFKGAQGSVKVSQFSKIKKKAQGLQADASDSASRKSIAQGETLQKAGVNADLPGYTP